MPGVSGGGAEEGPPGKSDTEEEEKEVCFVGGGMMPFSYSFSDLMFLSQTPIEQENCIDVQKTAC